MAQTGPEPPAGIRGQGMVEYGMMVGILAMLVIASFIALGPQVTDQFQQTINEQTMADGRVSISANIYGDQ